MDLAIKDCSQLDKELTEIQLSPPQMTNRWTTNPRDTLYVSHLDDYAAISILPVL
jgi:hypothetical protein